MKVLKYLTSPRFGEALEYGLIAGLLTVAVISALATAMAYFPSHFAR